MPKEFNRSDRVADAVQRSLARLIPAEVADPRVRMVNINAVMVSKDLSLAKIYVTFVGITDEKACREGVEVLNKAANFLRSLMSKELSVRSTPKVQFFYDESTVRGQALRSLIAQAIAADQAAHREASSGQEVIEAPKTVEERNKGDDNDGMAS